MSKELLRRKDAQLLERDTSRCAFVLRSYCRAFHAKNEYPCRDSSPTHNKDGERCRFCQPAPGFSRLDLAPLLARAELLPILFDELAYQHLAI